MGRKRNNGLSEEKRNIIGQLIEVYDIRTAADIQEASAGRHNPEHAGDRTGGAGGKPRGIGLGVSQQSERVQAEAPAVEHGRDTDSGAAGSEHRL